MTHSGFVLGVDGCRQGWVGVVLPVEEAAGDPARGVGARPWRRWPRTRAGGRVGVDMPLHLTDDPWPRPADVAARGTWAEGCHPVRHAARLRLRGGRLRRGLRRRPRAHGQRLAGRPGRCGRRCGSWRRGERAGAGVGGPPGGVVLAARRRRDPAAEVHVGRSGGPPPLLAPGRGSSCPPTWARRAAAPPPTTFSTPPPWPGPPAGSWPAPPARSPHRPSSSRRPPRRRSGPERSPRGGKRLVRTVVQTWMLYSP